MAVTSCAFPLASSVCSRLVHSLGLLEDKAFLGADEEDRDDISKGAQEDHVLCRNSQVLERSFHSDYSVRSDTMIPG